MPPFFQFQFLGRALSESFDVISHPRDDDPGDIHFPAKRPDIRQHHIEGKKRGNTCVGSQCFQFVNRIHGVQIDNDGAQILGGIIGNNVLGTIRQVNPDAITLFNTHLRHGIGHPQNLLSEIPEGHFGTVKIGCRLVRKIARGNV